MTSQPRGLFITLEGIDGAGKSSHLDSIEALFVAAGRRVTRTREPGGTPLAEALRELVLHQPMDALAESLLVFAARRDHVVQVIAPALARGDVVLCDRFTDATFAYQGGGRGFDTAVLSRLEQAVHGQLQPDLTIWFDLDPLLAAQRRAQAREADRFEQRDVDYFARVRAAYAQRCEADAARFARLDAALPREQVAAQLDAVLEARGW